MSEAQLSFSMNGHGIAHHRRKTKRVVKNGHATTELVLTELLNFFAAAGPRWRQEAVAPAACIRV